MINHKIFDFGRFKLRYIYIGIISDAVLYIIFYCGNIVSGFLFPFKDIEIDSVHSNKSGTNTDLMAALLVFIIGPGEEIYWRAFLCKMF